MTLRKKTLLIIAGTSLGLIVVVFFVLQNLLLSGFAKLEERSTHQNVERALSALSGELSHLESTTSDWSSWDDTYVFAQDANNEYIQSNLGNETLITLRLNLMLFINSSGQTIFGKAFDLSNEKEIPIPQSLCSHLSTNVSLVTHPESSIIPQH